MQTDLPVARLSDVAEVRSGFAFKSSDMGKSGVPLIKIKNITPPTVDVQDVERVPEEAIRNVPRAERYRLAQGDIVIAMTGATVGKVGRFPKTEETYYLNQRVGKVYLKDATAADYNFLYYVLAQPHYVDQMFGWADGSAQANISGAQIERLEIPLPPIPEQRAIAHILGTLDDKIELNRRMNETLEAMARALFKSWFVDFDPVRAKAEGRDPGLPKPIADLFPDSFEDSELGEIPKGWDVGTLIDFASLNPEGWSKETRSAVINYVDLSNTKWGRIEAIIRYAQQDAPSRAQRVLRPGDTIVGTVRPGNGSYALVSMDGLTGSTGFAVLRPRKPEYAPFIYLAATASENIEALAHLADGGAYPAVRPEVVGTTQVVRPGGKVIGQFAGFCEPLLANFAQHELESSTLAALRDTLLPKLISGELRVKDTSHLLETAP